MVIEGSCAMGIDGIEEDDPKEGTADAFKQMAVWKVEMTLMIKCTMATTPLLRCASIQ